MTTAELIKELKKYMPETEVFLTFEGSDYSCVKVEELHIAEHIYVASLVAG